ncbi:GGDEF domain-containing protein [Hoeflea sp. AS60]|uniref:GGDEF domain-containing protein n=1 Tax=Hoeflea sp. AS60 TaxID=3135780 RepID=UPI00316B87A3
MVGVTRNWIVRQLSLGEFDSHRQVWRRSTVMACKIGVLAYVLDIASHIILDAFGLLPYSLASSLIIATVLTPALGFFLALTSYLVIGFAIHDLGVSRNELERLSRTDTLSGLANRRAFLDQFDRCERKKAMLVFDIDRFKSVNDTHGHLVGDEVISRVADVLSTVFCDRCVCARIGGEEFTVFCHDMPFAEFAALGEIARVRIAGMQIETENSGFSVTLSGGLARALPNEQFGEVFSRADKALYAAKSGGRNQIVLCYDASSTVQRQDGPIQDAV